MERPCNRWVWDPVGEAKMRGKKTHKFGGGRGEGGEGGVGGGENRRFLGGGKKTCSDTKNPYFSDKSYCTGKNSSRFIQYLSCPHRVPTPPPQPGFGARISGSVLSLSEVHFGAADREGILVLNFGSVLRSSEAKTDRRSGSLRFG